MQTDNNPTSALESRWVKVVYSAYGAFILLLWFIRHIREPYIKFLPSLKTYADVLCSLYFITSTYLYPPLVNLIIFFGLITHKRWARYGVIASMLTLPIALSLSFLVWGPLFSTGQVALQIFFMIVITVFFLRFPLPQHRGAKFRLKSFAGILVIVIMLMSIWPIYPSLHMKYTVKEPLFISKGENLVIDPDEYAVDFAVKRKLHVPGVSLYVPYRYRLGFMGPAEGSSWGMWLRNNPDTEESLITLEYNNIYRDFFDSPELSRLGLTNALAFDRFMYTNNWNPGAITYRVIAAHGVSSYREFIVDGLPGILLQREGPSREFKLYKKDGSLLLSGSLRADKSNDAEDIVKALIASVTPEPDMPAASHFYEQGQGLYNKGEFIDAQFAFAQAYLLRPDDAEYAYMLVRSLLPTREKFYGMLAENLERSLELNPGHEKTKALLEEVRRLEQEEDNAKSPPE